MQIEKKLILCSILAVAIGISTVTPLAFLMTPATAQAAEDQPRFSFEMPYAYVRNVWDNSTLTNETDGYDFAVGFDTSPNFDFSEDAVAYYETFRAELCADGASVGNIILRTFAISNPGINASDKVDNLARFFDKWCEYPPIDGSSEARGAWCNGTSHNIKYGYDDNWTLATGEPQSLTMIIYRENFAICTVNSTQIILDENPEPIAQFELTRYRDGYLYNTAIPMEELDQINPAWPMIKDLT